MIAGNPPLTLNLPSKAKCQDIDHACLTAGGCVSRIRFLPHSDDTKSIQPIVYDALFIYLFIYLFIHLFILCDEQETFTY